MRIRSPFCSFAASCTGIALILSGSLVGVVAGPTAPAGAASAVYAHTCFTSFDAGVTAVNPAQITIEDTSTTPGVADLRVAFPAGPNPNADLLHAFTGTTQWTSSDAQVVWNGVTSPAASFVWHVYPVVDQIVFSTGPFAAPTSPDPQPGLISWHFLGDATIPPSPGPGYDSGQTSCRRSPDLTVDISHSGDFATGERAARSEIVVSNPSPYPGGDTTLFVDVTLPAEIQQDVTDHRAAVSLSGSGWTCENNVDTGLLRCSRYDALPAGESYPAISLEFDVPADVTTPLTTSVTITGGGDQTPANNTASDAATMVGYASTYSPAELRLLDTVGTRIGDPNHANVQRTGGLFMAFLDGIIVQRNLTPPTFGSSWPWVPYFLDQVTTVYTSAEDAMVTTTASRFSTDVPSLQRLGVLLIAYLISLPPA